jgi:hypothetical protein
MADEHPSLEKAKQRLAEDRQAGDRARAEYAERMKGKPTPTQEENDLAACGAHFPTHEDDGSGSEPWNQRKALEPDRPAAGAYQTRQASPAAPAHSRQPPPRHTGGE